MFIVDVTVVLQSKIFTFDWRVSEYGYGAAAAGAQAGYVFWCKERFTHPDQYAYQLYIIQCSH